MLIRSYDNNEANLQVFQVTYLDNSAPSWVCKVYQAQALTLHCSTVQ